MPDSVRACLFDLDGVLTDTAAIHRAAWGAAFDPVLAERGQRAFSDHDYDEYVDGKPRLDGVRDFLASREIKVLEGGPDDAAGTETIYSIGTRKNEDVLRLIKTEGVHVFEGSRRFLQAATDARLHRVVVSSSANAEQVLEVTGLAQYVQARIDGVTIQALGIRGKPAPDSFLAGAQRAGVEASAAAVFEDATAGVAAGRAGNFGFVIGVNRKDDAHGTALRDNGADIIVTDLADLL